MFETAAPFFRVDDSVRLTRDIPELWLRRGDMGVVVSTWCAPSVAYEIEFDRMHDADTCRPRVLLLPESLSARCPHRAS